MSKRRSPAKSGASQSADRSQRYAALSVQLSQSAAEEDALSASSAAASGDRKTTHSSTAGPCKHLLQWALVVFAAIVPALAMRTPCLYSDIVSQV